MRVMCLPEFSVRYIGRFAPSPTGLLHAGSLVAALASWLDAHAHKGQWLVRIEDVDTPRCVTGADLHILEQLAACGLVSDAPVLYQSQRSHAYQARHKCVFHAVAQVPVAAGAQAVGWVVLVRHAEW